MNLLITRNVLHIAGSLIELYFRRFRTSMSRTISAWVRNFNVISQCVSFFCAILVVVITA